MVRALAAFQLAGLLLGALTLPALTLPAPAAAQGSAQSLNQPYAPPPIRRSAGPQFALVSDIVLRELAFKRLKVEKGLGAALKTFAAKDAWVALPPHQARAANLRGLKIRLDEEQARSLAPRAIFMSCDGSHAAALVAGAANLPPEAHIWQRDGKGQYRLILLLPASAPAEGEFIEGKLAQCNRPAPASAATAPIPANLPKLPDTGPDHRNGAAPDQSLIWQTGPAGLRIWLKQNGTLTLQN